jgi:hypothetical protein
MSKEWRSVRPAEDEYAQFYSGYIARVPSADIVDTLSRQIAETAAFLRSLPESVGDHAYAPGKWTIRQVIGHLGDGERVFGYRALRFSRGDTTPVPGFDENLYVDNSRFAHRTLDDLITELEYLRRSSICLFNGLDEEAMSRRGTANDNEVSVRALAFIMAGHELHTLEIIRTRYL